MHELIGAVLRVAADLIWWDEEGPESGDKIAKVRLRDELRRVTEPWKRASRGLISWLRTCFGTRHPFLGLSSQYRNPLVIGLYLVMNLSDVGNFVGYRI